MSIFNANELKQVEQTAFEKCLKLQEGTITMEYFKSILKKGRLVGSRYLGIERTDSDYDYLFDPSVINLNEFHFLYYAGYIKPNKNEGYTGSLINYCLVANVEGIPYHLIISEVSAYAYELYVLCKEYDIFDKEMPKETRIAIFNRMCHAKYKMTGGNNTFLTYYDTWMYQYDSIQANRNNNTVF